MYVIQPESKGLTGTSGVSPREVPKSGGLRTKNSSIQGQEKLDVPAQEENPPTSTILFPSGPQLPAHTAKEDPLMQAPESNANFFQIHTHRCT